MEHGGLRMGKLWQFEPLIDHRRSTPDIMWFRATRVASVDVDGRVRRHAWRRRDVDAAVAYVLNDNASEDGDPPLSRATVIPSTLQFRAQLSDANYGVLYLFRDGTTSKQCALLWYSGPDFSHVDPISSNWFTSRLTDADTQRLLQTMRPVAKDRSRPWRRSASSFPSNRVRSAVVPVANTVDEWFQSRMGRQPATIENDDDEPPAKRNRRSVIM